MHLAVVRTAGVRWHHVLNHQREISVDLVAIVGLCHVRGVDHLHSLEPRDPVSLLKRTPLVGTGDDNSSAQGD